MAKLQVDEIPLLHYTADIEAARDGVDNAWREFWMLLSPMFSFPWRLVHIMTVERLQSSIRYRRISLRNRPS